jgi:hypothetical protein
MLYSDAYNNLNYPSVIILGYVIMQLKKVKIPNKKSSKDKYVYVNKDEINLHYSTFKNPPFKMGNQTITRAIDILLSRGFITIKSQGGMHKGHSSVYGYSEKWRNWKEGDPPIEERKPFRKRGFTNKK